MSREQRERDQQTRDLEARCQAARQKRRDQQAAAQQRERVRLLAAEPWRARWSPVLDRSGKPVTMRLKTVVRSTGVCPLRRSYFTPAKHRNFGDLATLRMAMRDGYVPKPGDQVCLRRGDEFVSVVLTAKDIEQLPPLQPTRPRR